MKKLTMIGMAALLMLAVSCKKDKKDEIENAGSGFRATVESHEGTGKTHLDGKAVKWNSGDVILVKSSTCTTPKRFTTTGTGASANFDAAESLPENFYTPDYTAYYPADMFSGDQLTLPATQTYVANTFANGANPMAAISKDTKLDFKNVCGVLELQLYNSSPCNVQNVTITSNKSGEMLWGKGVVTIDNAGIPSLGTLTGGGNSIVLSCGDGVALSTNRSAPSTFFFVVPAGSLGSSFTVKVTTTDGKIWTKTADSPQNTISRSIITVMPLTETAGMHEPIVPSEVTLYAGCSNEYDFIYTISGSVTVPSGSQECEFGLVYSQTDNTPTIEEGAVRFPVHTAADSPVSGTVEFSASLPPFEEGVTYYVRTYAMCESTAYSATLPINGDDVPQRLPSSWVNGENPHPFTVGPGPDKKYGTSDDVKVHFSQGNLQYIGSDDAPYWKFAEHQFDILGNSTGQAGIDPRVDRDLFSWGTSGYNHGAHIYQPWEIGYWGTTGYNGEYAYFYAYGDIKKCLYQEDGRADWGYNAIRNGGNAENMWHTLSGEMYGYGLYQEDGEWDVLIRHRLHAESLYGQGMIGGCTPGLIILPDDWVKPDGLSFIPGPSKWANSYSYSAWARMEAAGAVFLPVAGYRRHDWQYAIHNYRNTSIEGDYYGGYHSSSVLFYCETEPYFVSGMFFSGYNYDTNTDNGYVAPDLTEWRCDGYAVRLVRYVH